MNLLRYMRVDSNKLTLTAITMVISIYICIPRGTKTEQTINLKKNDKKKIDATNATTCLRGRQKHLHHFNQ